MFTINNDIAIDLLIERVKHWTDDSKILELFRKMYEDYLDSGCFDGYAYSIDEIVDNDYINNCEVRTLHEFDEDTQKILLNAVKNGDRDISCETSYSFIEAVDNEENPNLFLMRY